MRIPGLLVAALLTGCGVSPPPTAEERTPTTATESEPSATSATAAREIPDDFPLAAGWPPDDATEPGPRYGLRGPHRRLERISWERCGERLAVTGENDALGATWSNVEDYRSRELATFRDADAAVAFTTTLVNRWRSCRSEPTGDGYERVNRVLGPTGAGGESWALVSWAEYDGSPAVGLQVSHVTRLGRAVLVDTASNEGGGGPHRDADILAQVDEQLRTTGEVVAAMCLFTEAGCAP